MLRAIRAGCGIAAVLIVLWAGLGLWIWNLNRVPQPPVPARHLPEGNVYERYVELATRVKEPRTLVALQRERKASGADVERALRANAETLEELSRLSGKPCMVTELMPGEKFVGALAFPGVTRAAALASRRYARSDPERAFKAMVAALHFSAGVMRGGASLHVTTGFLSFVPVFDAAPDLLPHLTERQCADGARMLRDIDAAMTTATDVMRAERAVRLEQLARTVRPGATRIFRFDIPRESYEWAFLRKPKKPAYESLDAYMAKWVAEAAKPLTAISPPEGPAGLEGILADESLESTAMLVHLIRHAYIRARIRVLHAALALEAARKRTGSYPDRLEAAVSGDMLADPFSVNRLVYARSGSGYKLYSVGPNGKDDGGTLYTESRMKPGGIGDLPLRPNF